jgi:hypothetical protein
MVDSRLRLLPHDRISLVSSPGASGIVVFHEYEFDPGAIVAAFQGLVPMQKLIPV